MLKPFAKTTLTYLPSKLLPMLTGFISAPLLTHLFLPDKYGDMALANGVSDFLFALAISGLGSAAVRFFPAYKAQGRVGVFLATLGASTLGLTALTSAAYALLLLALRNSIAPHLYPLLWISIALFVGQAIYTIPLVLLRAQENSRLYTAFELWNRYGSLGLGLLLVLAFGMGVDGLLWGSFLGFALAAPLMTLVVCRGAKVTGGDVRKDEAGSIWRYAWPLALGNMAMWGLRLSDRYVVGAFRPADEVGLYSVAYNLSGKSIDLLVAPILLSAMPMIMNLWESRGREAAEKALDMVSRSFLIICLPAVAGLAALAGPLVDLLTAPPYHDGYKVLGWVALGSLAWGMSQIAGTGMLLGKRTRRIAVNQGIAAAVNLGLNFLLVPRYGFVVAGITTGIGYALLTVLQVHGSRSYLSWRPPWKTLLNTVIASTVMGLAVAHVPGLTIAHGRIALGLALLAAVAGGVAIYLVVLFVLGEIRPEEKAVIRQVIRKLVGAAA